MVFSFSPLLVFILQRLPAPQGLEHTYRLGVLAYFIIRQQFEQMRKYKLYKYIYIYTQYKTNILKCFYLIAFSNLVVQVVHCFLEKKHEKRKKKHVFQCLFWFV